MWCGAFLAPLLAPHLRLSLLSFLSQPLRAAAVATNNKQQQSGASKEKGPVIVQEHVPKVKVRAAKFIIRGGSSRPFPA